MTYGHKMLSDQRLSVIADLVTDNLNEESGPTKVRRSIIHI